MDSRQVPFRRVKEVEFGLREFVLIVEAEGVQPNGSFLDFDERAVR